jgi:hypothetical protein
MNVLLGILQKFHFYLISLRRVLDLVIERFPQLRDELLAGFL